MYKSFINLTMKAFLLAALLAAVGCTRLGAPVTAQSPEGQQPVIRMQASDFKFEPNNIRVPEPGTLTLIIQNISGTEHNITIQNPEGQVLTSVDLPRNQTTPVSVNLSAPGKYDFHCDKDLHAALGMKGEIEVGS